MKRARLGTGYGLEVNTVSDSIWRNLFFHQFPELLLSLS